MVAAFTLEDIPSDGFIQFYSIAELLSMLIAVLSFGFTVFIIRKASPPAMGTYRWFLLNELVANIFYDLVNSAYSVIPLFPHQCGMSTGWLGRRLDALGLQSLNTTFACACAWKMFALWMALLHRTMHALPTAVIRSRFAEKVVSALSAGKSQIYVFLCAWICMQLAVVAFAQSVRLGDQSAAVAALITVDPIFAELLRIPAPMVCYREEVHDLYIAVAVALLLFCSSFPILMTAAYRWMSSTRHFVSKSTFRLQSMLLVSIFVQIVVTATFIVVPFFVIFGVESPLVGAKIHGAPQLMSMALLLSGLHSTADCIVLIYFVTPYRRYVAVMIGRSEMAAPFVEKTARSITVQTAT